jgi:homogentisate phytyltransferase / homogentisate geranylgeranyltransferase
MTWIASFWKFSRPHTIVGTSLSVLAIYLIAIITTDSTIDPVNGLQMLYAWLACLCGNVYIVGLNQLTDIEIDRINKPDLPLAAGNFSPTQGWWIVGITGILAITISACSGIWLLATVAVSLIIGTAYSLPPIRLKQFPLLAAFCIFTVRGIIVNLGLFLHFSRQITGQEFLNYYIGTLSLFVLLFTISIAIFKDVPDLEGDRKYNITTFTLILGKTAIFKLSRSIITICYLGIIIAGILWLKSVNYSLFIGYHSVLLAWLWWKSSKVDLEQKSSIANFYQFIWKLFFLEYLLFPAACFIKY